MAAIKPPTAKSAISQRILSEATVLKMILLEQEPHDQTVNPACDKELYGLIMRWQ